ncbi:hypothetical protein BVI2075_230105 [Burkholderia vietnamiensis]|nr:hypothetical protein BVI2075_230105 [Burkholderia vietnamiensis]CAG9229486.1 hypothetical protein BVI1335_70218 [Burkholderia vietnamiensis]
MPEFGQKAPLHASRLRGACMVCIQIGMARRPDRAARESATARLIPGNQSMDRYRA